MIGLNVCCGDNPIPGDWTNIDVVDRGHNVVVEDIRKLPYEDNSVDVIYSSHTLEYLNREEGFQALKGFHRVLKKGGELYTAVPDFGALAEAYVDGDVPLFRLLGPLYGQMDVNGTVYHKTVYDSAALGDVLRLVGFRKVKNWVLEEFLKFNDSGKFDDCSDARIGYRLISLNLKCVKV